MSKRNEVVLRLVNVYGLFIWRDGTYDNTICAEILGKEMVVPDGCNRLIVVFTKDSQEDSYTITTPVGGWGITTTVLEYKGLLYFRARQLLAKKYHLGYRYVHFECE